MSKVLDLNKTVAELVEEYPEVKDIMAGLGFTHILNPEALKTAGTIMTIPMGAEAMGIDLSRIKDAFTKAGFEVKA